MVKDVTPELLKKIKTTFVQNIEKNRKIKSIKKKIDLKTATHIDSHEFGIEVGKCLSRAFKKELSSDVLPDGRMYYNIAKRIMNETFQRNYQLVQENAKEVHQILNEQAHNHLLVETPINQDRLNGIIERLAGEENYDKVSWLLDEPVVNFSQSVVDDFIQKNAEFQYQAGQTPKITRIATGHKPCDWCQALAGTYRYPGVDKKVFQRHANCRCIVDYHPGDGRVQNVHSKQFLSNNIDKGLNDFRAKSLDNIVNREKGKYQEKVDKTRRKLKNHLLGQNVNGVKIKNISEHTAERVILRDLNIDEILDAINNPIKIENIKYDAQNRPSFKVIGEKTTVYINPKNGAITTMHKTSSKLVRKMKGEQNENRS